MPVTCEFEKRTKLSKATQLDFGPIRTQRLLKEYLLRTYFGRMQGLGFGKCDGIPLSLGRAINFS